MVLGVVEEEIHNTKSVIGIIDQERIMMRTGEAEEFVVLISSDDALDTAVADLHGVGGAGSTHCDPNGYVPNVDLLPRVNAGESRVKRIEDSRTSQISDCSALGY
ncbi:hypothetical protein [Halapricum desulfuricans]|uniref:hypothetical protein n=1 Tax=Halapricum desulfuricans TaxID=2841257 RepID=UPI001E60A023|nr:hypothetical protein [Halapricum desulfuricans]